MTMQTTTDTLRTRALDAMRPAAPVGVAPRKNFYATITVTLPDGSTGVASAADVACATTITRRDAQPAVRVRQGKRVDLWHVSQLA